MFARLRLLRQTFVRLSALYEQRLGPRRAHIVLKRNHSLRVQTLALKIAAREALSHPELHGAAALLHDIGRFSQFERFGTYRDDQSVDHGEEGARVLESSDVLADFDAGERTSIVETVRWHNKRELPDGQAPLLRSLCLAVRDADKLDIASVVLSALLPDTPHDHVVTLGLADEPATWSDTVHEALVQGICPAYQDLRVINDFKLLLAGWGPGLNFWSSRQIFADRGYLQRLFDLLPQDVRLSHLKAGLEQRLAR